MKHEKACTGHENSALDLTHEWKECKQFNCTNYHQMAEQCQDLMTTTNKPHWLE